MSDVPPDSLLPQPPEQGESLGPAGGVTVPERVVFKSPWGSANHEQTAYSAASAEPDRLAAPVQGSGVQPTSVLGRPVVGRPVSSPPVPSPLTSHPAAPLVTDLQFAVRASEQVPVPETDPEEPSSRAPLHVSSLTPAQGGWAAILLLLIQNLVVGIAQYWHAPLGASLILAFCITILGFSVVLPYPMKLLREDSRWRTRPRFGVMLGAFALGFVASRGIMLFGVSVWPAALSAIPPLLSKGSDMLLLFIGASLCIPIAEEIAFRGLLLRGLERARGPIYAAAYVSLLFGMAHGSPLQVLAIAPLAWVMARAVQYSGSLWTSIGMHMLNNGLAVGLGYALRGRVTSSPLGGLEASAIAEKVPFAMGLAGLLIGVASLVVATAWLKPVTAAQMADPAPRVWTVSTIILLLLALMSMGYALWTILGAAHGVNF